jgi:hypothetical protein
VKINNLSHIIAANVVDRAQMQIDEAMPISRRGFVSGRLKGLSNCKNAYSRLIENRLDILE